jgi:hypothetical protein
MRKNLLLILTAGTLLGTTTRILADEAEPGFISLSDGKTFNGWKMSEENQDTWKIEDGAFVTHGKTCHLYYVGDQQPFKNFHLKVDVMTDPVSNGGIYFHTNAQEKPGARLRVPGQNTRMAIGSRRGASGASSTWEPASRRTTSGGRRKSSSKAAP